MLGAVSAARAIRDESELRAVIGSQALIRSDLWNPELHIARSELPSSGQILRSLTDPGFDAEEYDRARAARYARREGLY
jgi:uncharacterized protein